MYQPTARSGPACLASLFVRSPVPITRPYHEKPSFDGYRSGLFESGRPPEPCCGVPEWTRRCAPRPRRCGIRGPAHSWSLSPRSARPRSASSPPWSSATSLISRPVRPCLGHPHPAHRPGHRHRAALPAQRSQEGPRRAGSAGGARVKGSSNGSSNGEASHGGAATPPLATGPGGSTALAVLPLPKDRAGWRVRATASPDPAFGDCVHAGRPHLAQHGPDPGVHQDRVEDVSEVRSPVADHEFRPLCLSAKVHKQVAGLLGASAWIMGRVF